jgi:hypothetical protein
MKAGAFYFSFNVNLITKTWIIGIEDILDLCPPHAGIYTTTVDDEINNLYILENLVVRQEW